MNPVGFILGAFNLALAVLWAATEDWSAFYISLAAGVICLLIGAVAS